MFDEACSVLQVAERLVEADFRVRFDVPVQVGGVRKVPDIFVEDSSANRTFYCEVSDLFNADAVVDASRVLNLIFAVLPERCGDPLQLCWCGRVLESVEETKIVELIARIHAGIDSVRKDSSLHEVIIPDVLELALAPEESANAFEAWAHERGLKINSLTGAPKIIDHDFRLRRKIDVEARHRPANLPNLLVISAQDLFISVEGPSDLFLFAINAISRHPNVAGLVLTSEYVETVIPLTTKVGDNLITLSGRDGLKHQSLFVLNPSCGTKIPVYTLDKLRLAFSL
jgi:hypothetical protein